MKLLNLGILAHVDAGKTSLTERLLYAAGVIDEIGSVDDGSTQTDSLALERQRGITIKSAVVSFAIDDITVNLIDTPGHPDFIAEVERALSVLDGAVLVISAVEGVQAQTRVLMRTLQRLRIPTLIFVNKIDRAGAQYEPLLKTHRGQAVGRDRRRWVRRRPRHARRRVHAVRRETTPGSRASLLDVLAEHDDQLLATYVENEKALSYDALRTPAGRADRSRRWCTRCTSARRSPAPGTDALTAGHPRTAARRPRATPVRRSTGPSSRSNAARPARRSPTSGCSRARSGRPRTAAVRHRRRERR